MNHFLNEKLLVNGFDTETNQIHICTQDQTKGFYISFEDIQSLIKKLYLQYGDVEAEKFLIYFNK